MIARSHAWLLAWAGDHVTGVDLAAFSRDALWGIYARRMRRESITGSVDRLSARVVWPEVVGPLPWRSLAIAGPRGVLP